MNVVFYYVNLLAYFYVALCTIFLPKFIMDRYLFRSMMAYNIYIEQLPKKNSCFFGKTSRTKFFFRDIWNYCIDKK